VIDAAREAGLGLNPQVVREPFLRHDPFVDITPLRADGFAADAPRPEVNRV